MGGKKISRRRLIGTAAVAVAALGSPPFVRTSHAAGKLTLGMWDHWVPGANDALRRLVDEWADANRVEVAIDFITSIGNKNALTARAEARARVGHDIMAHPTWQVAVHHRQLEPLDDIVAEVEKAHGRYAETAMFLCRFDGTWKGIPAPTGTHTFPMVSRLDLLKQHAGVDLQQVFPAARDQRKKDLVEGWTYDAFLGHAEKLHRAGRPFANPIAPTGDGQNWLAPLFLSFGSVMVNAKNEIAVDSEETRRALEYMVRLAKFMPSDVHSWDDASNNDWLVSGRGACIFNPPSAWSAARREKPEIAAQLWHHDTPRGPNGRFRACLPYFWGIWDFARNKSAAKELMRFMCGKEAARRLVAASQGYDLSLLPSFLDFDTWAEAGPPKGTTYNYPTRGDETVIVAGYPAPAAMAADIYNRGLITQLVTRVTQGAESIEKAIAWARRELEGYVRG
ncbi:MAG: extracellular solute-binding protein [Alphaproteobacteria bacterium]|nr:extracellular solute-binding protein [Alphaproteobacteria bacterium]